MKTSYVRSKNDLNWPTMSHMFQQLRASIGFALLALLALNQTGCSLCSTPHDCDYPLYGGRHPRAEQQRGRLGSIYSDPELVGTVSHEPMTSDEIIVEQYPWDGSPEIIEGEEVEPGMILAPQPQ